MIERIGERPIAFPYVETKQVIFDEHYRSSLSSQKKENCCLSFFAWIFAPIIWGYEAICDKITLTTEELEVFIWE